jgi:hypothetical protein
MPLVKSPNRFGKKQSSPSAKKSAAKKTTRKPVVPVESKSNRKRTRSSAPFSSIRSKQLTVEKMKRSIWESLLKINDAIISAASNGNLASAKELFHFAGVYTLPNPDEENAATAALPPPIAAPETLTEPAPVHPIDVFFKRIGVEPSCLEPEPEVA